jgi:L-threonylcarbamoyladenylate synthase
MTGKLAGADLPESIERAAEVLRKGGIIIHPTETLYGFAANALLKNPIRRVDRIKKRGPHESYIVLVKDMDMAVQFGIAFDRTARKLAGRFWPGALTLVLPVSRNAPLIHLAVEGRIALRVSPDRSVRALFDQVQFPLISTSVNRSGHPPLGSPRKIQAVFGKEVDLILERGVISNTRPSTIAGVKDNVASIIRHGLITEEEIHAA